MADWLSGMLSGFVDRKGQIEQENLQRAEVSRRREGQIFESLINSPDPEIQSLAVAGLLDSAKPGKRKGGLSGWVGQLEQSPYLPQIQALINQPVRETKQIQAEPPTVQGYLGTPPPTTGGAAQAATSPTQGTPLATPEAGPTPTPTPSPIAGPPDPPIPQSLDFAGAEPRDLGPVAMDPRLATAPPTLKTLHTSRPREVFRSPEQSALLLSRSRAQGDVEGEIAGLVASGVPEAEAREVIKTRMLRQSRGGMTGQTYAEGNVVQDPASPTGWSQTLYLRADPSKTQTIPAASPLARSTRAVNSQEGIAHELFGRPGEDPRAVLSRLTPEEMQGVAEKKRTRDAEAAAALVTAKGAAASDVPLSTEQRVQETQRQFQRANTLRTDWEKVAAPSRQLRTSLATIDAALSAVRRGDHAAGSEALLVTYQKILDRLSVVRESEYLRPYYNQSLTDRVQGYVDQLRQGGARIPPAQLETYARLAKEIGGKVLTEDQQLAQAIRATAKTFQVEETLIFGNEAAGIGQPPPGGFSPPALSPILGTQPPAPGGATAPSRPTAPGLKKDAQGNWLITVP